MSRPDDPEVKSVNNIDETDVEALAEHYLAEAEAIQAESETAAEAEAEAEKVTEAVEAEKSAPLDDLPAESSGMAADNMPEEDFLPFTLSVADSDGLAVPVLEKGTKLPAAVKMNFSAPYKTPSAVKFRLYMGESAFAKDNILIGNLKLSGIREYRGGITRIVMNLRMERNGDIDIDLLDEGSVSRKHEKIELNLAECRDALKDKNMPLTEKDAELRDSYLVLQRGRFIAAAAERLLKANKKDIEKEKAVQIKGRIKELNTSVRKTDPAAMTPAQKSAMKNLMNEISAML